MSRGAIWLARQAQYDGEEPTPTTPEPEPLTQAATAKLGEIAIGAMMPDRLVSFWRWYGDLN
jgi:hypothetical protein